MKVLALLPALAATGAHGRLPPLGLAANVVHDRRLQFDAISCLIAGGDLESCCPSGEERRRRLDDEEEEDPFCSLLTCVDMEAISEGTLGVNSVNGDCTCEDLVVFCGSELPETFEIFLDGITAVCAGINECCTEDNQSDNEAFAECGEAYVTENEIDVPDFDLSGLLGLLNTFGAAEIGDGAEESAVPDLGGLLGSIAPDGDLSALLQGVAAAIPSEGDVPDLGGLLGDVLTGVPANPSDAEEEGVEAPLEFTSTADTNEETSANESVEDPVDLQETAALTFSGAFIGRRLAMLAAWGGLAVAGLLVL